MKHWLSNLSLLIACAFSVTSHSLASDHAALHRNRTRMVTSIHQFLTPLCDQNMAYESAHTSFNSLDIPQIAIGAYLYRLATSSQCSLSTLVITTIYLLRYSAQTHHRIDWFRIHRLLCTSFLVASKLDDVGPDNKSFARICLLSSTTELNDLEREFLVSLNFNLTITVNEYKQWYDRLNQIIEEETSTPMDAKRRKTNVTTMNATGVHF
eukprot:618986_1